MLNEKLLKKCFRVCTPQITKQLFIALKIPTEEALVIEKSFYFHLTEVQIADELAVSRETVQRMKKRALQKILHANQCRRHLDQITTELLQAMLRTEIEKTG